MADEKFLDYIPQAVARRLAESLDRVLELAKKAQWNEDPSTVVDVLGNAEETLDLIRRHRIQEKV